MSALSSSRLLETFTTFFPQADTLGSWVGGALVVGHGAHVSVVDPATGTECLRYADADAALVDRAAQCAVTGQRAWAGFSAARRGSVLYDIGRTVREHLEPLAQLESLSAGKPIRDCRAEVGKVAEMFAYYAGWADKLHGEVIPVPSGHLNYTCREPYGIMLVITPWNAPIFTCGWNVAPALATGNAVLLKPSELTTPSSLALAMLAERAGLPPGVLNVLGGYGHTTGQAAIAHAAVKKVVFIGSPGTGAQIAAACAARSIACVLELGGSCLTTPT